MLRRVEDVDPRTTKPGTSNLESEVLGAAKEPAAFSNLSSPGSFRFYFFQLPSVLQWPTVGSLPSGLNPKHPQTRDSGVWLLCSKISLSATDFSGLFRAELGFEARPEGHISRSFVYIYIYVYKYIRLPLHIYIYMREAPFGSI